MATTPTTLLAGKAPTAAALATYKTAILELQAANGLPSMASDSTGGTTTSTTYTSTLSGVTTPLSLTFVAAKTSVAITVSTLITQQTSGPWNQFMAPVVIGATDGYSYGPNDADAATGQFTNNNVGSVVERTTVITGLTVGNSYTITPQYKSGGVQCTFGNRRIVVHD